jgi:hypothetical protein
LKISKWLELSVKGENILAPFLMQQISAEVIYELEKLLFEKPHFRSEFNPVKFRA